MHVNFVQNLAWYNRAFFDHTELVLFVLLWQFWKLLFKNNVCTCSLVQPSSIHRKCPPELSLDGGTEKEISNGSETFYHKFSLAAACKHHRGLFPFSYNFTSLLIFGKCPLVPWMYSRMCATARHPLLTVTHSIPVGSVSWPQISASALVRSLQICHLLVLKIFKIYLCPLS